MTKMHELAELGQSIWIDYIRRSFLTSGELPRLIQDGLRGMTSNPSIFEKAIAHSNDYDEDFQRLVAAGKSAQEIYSTLVLDDIRRAADLFRPVYEQTEGADGYVSIEVDPRLAHDTQATLAEARQLWQQVDRPNVMIKIPGTAQGLTAITRATAEGINVNITLIFSLERYAEVMAAYIAGLEDRLEAGQPVDRIHSVASFFVSRVDTKVDKLLEPIIQAGGERAALASKLRGQAAVANARMAYHQFRTVFESARFSGLQDRGANLQRPLWASTSTKNPDYSDILYVQELIAPHTVNTLPQETLEAFNDHGQARLTLEGHLDETRFTLQSLEELGISMAQVTQELEDEGVAAFAKSFDSLMASLNEKRRVLLGSQQATSAGQPPAQPVGELPQLQFGPGIDPRWSETALDEMERDRIVRRIWQHDYTVWEPKPDEITNRLGWLHAAEDTLHNRQPIDQLVQDVKQAGYNRALLLGMGGSSLAPELFGSIFSDQGGLQLTVLDSTDPEAVLAYSEQIDPTRTLFIVSTKSGTTEETLSYFKYFYNWCAGPLGADQAGAHFIAITDPGSKLVDLAQRYHFRATFLNDPNIGGRYSALSYFGMAPAALAGVDLSRLLGNAGQMARACGEDTPARQNPAARLGALMAECAKAGRDKLTFIIPEAIAGFGDWVEQLIAESLGKEGKGILPVVREPLGAPAAYGHDRLFVHLALTGSDAENAQAAAVKDLEDSGLPVVHISLKDRYDLGGQFLLWELATAVAGYRMGIHPFDQPNVESTKVLVRQMVATFKSSGKLPAETPALSRDGIEVYLAPATGNPVGLPSAAGPVQPATPSEALTAFLSQAKAGDYVTLQAFIRPDKQTHRALQDLRRRIRDRYRLATTGAFGPRYLHSTGQLHKGDAGNGLFIQFTSDHPHDAPIPDEAGSPASSITFGVLELAQSMGDRQALLAAGRRIIRFHLVVDPLEGIRGLVEALG